MFTIYEIIDLAVQIEKNGEKVYRDALKKVSDPAISSMLQKFADDEAEHIKWFTRFKEEVKGEKIDTRLEEMGRAILLNVLGDQSFSLEEVDFTRIEQVKELLEFNMEFEKDTVTFYEMICSFVQDDETLKQLEEIIEEENQHIRITKEMLDSIHLL